MMNSCFLAEKENCINKEECFSFPILEAASSLMDKTKICTFLNGGEGGTQTYISFVVSNEQKTII